MNNSVENVTLFSGFILDLLEAYKDKESIAKELFEMAKNLNLNKEKTDELVPMETYNEMCTYIENKFGASSIRNAGEFIASRAYDFMVNNLKIENNPLSIMQALKYAADNMIQDPQKRGWEILESSDNKIIMRRTQTFNCILQESLLRTLVTKTGVKSPMVNHDKCTRKGDEFCEYQILWFKIK